jgi:hypothetical protein
MYLVFALAMVGYVLTVRRMRAFARFDSEVPEAVPDDLVGWRERRRRAAALLVAEPADRPVPQRAEEAVQ